jgi:restriction endonuclease Mrr
MKTEPFSGKSCVGMLLAYAIFFGGLFGGITMGKEIGAPWLGAVFAFGGLFVLYLATKQVTEARLEDERQRENQKRAEDECRRNSPEEIERRRLELERLNAELEERERQRKAEEERAAREKWVEYHRYPRLEEIDAMDGIQFEFFVKDLLERLAYHKVRTTPKSGDQGADLLAITPNPHCKKAVVQTKRWRGPVGNSAIQEVLGAMLFYDAEFALVFTNSTFSASARALAAKETRIRLVGREKLHRMIRQAFNQDVPEFDWTTYNERVKNWRHGR